MQLLIKKGADDYNGALRAAARGGLMEDVQLLVDKSGADALNAAFQAASEGREEAAAALRRPWQGSDHESVIHFLEGKIADSDSQGSKRNCTPDNISSSAKRARVSTSPELSSPGLEGSA